MNPERIGVLMVLTRLSVAFILALPLAWERQAERHVGLRTVPLVSVGACGYLLLAEHLGADAEGRTRVLQGLLSGMGFIGAGAILKRGGDVVGIATAATIWNTGAIGGATAFGDYPLAIILSVINIGVLILGRLLHKSDVTPPRQGDGDGDGDGDD
jgi:putative Mg2+ transporter-C (MgtC) family protein